MKKIFLSIALAMTSMFAMAQAQTMTAGVNLLYGTNIKNFGIGAKAAYYFTDDVRGEASVNYFFPNGGFSMLEVNANAHYLVNINSKFSAYPLAGITLVYGHWSNGGGSNGGNIDIPGDDEDWGWGAPMKKSAGVSTQSVGGGNGTLYLGFNLGGGVEYNITDHFVLNAEIRYSLVKDLYQGVFSVGASYRF